MTVRQRSSYIAALLAALLTSSAHAEDRSTIVVMSPGETLYLAHCGLCHLERGTGTTMLGRRLGPDRALLAQRTDLHADYVRTVVRAGLNSMPALTRVEVTDVELDAIASYLSHPKPNHAASK